MINKYFHSDNVGAFSSALCLLHCIATPFLFIAQSCAVSSCCAPSDVVPSWWVAFDYIFLAISLVAVYFTTQHTSKPWITPAFYASWLFLAGILLNEKFGFFPIAEEAVYLPAAMLVILHIYNRRYCQCADDTCCTKN